VQRLRGNVRDLRALLVDLHPPNLAAEGIEAALADLAAPLRTRGVEVGLEVSGAEALSREREALVYRVAQEALRNVVAHAGAVSSVSVRLDVAEGAVRLEIADDGAGFDDAARRQRGAGG
jgi:two-component system, NarL family, sensor kinase